MRPTAPFDYAFFSFWLKATFAKWLRNTELPVTKLFISYSRVSEEYADDAEASIETQRQQVKIIEKFSQALENASLIIWHDTREVSPGDLIYDEITDAIASSHVIVLMANLVYQKKYETSLTAKKSEPAGTPPKHVLYYEVQEIERLKKKVLPISFLEDDRRCLPSTIRNKKEEDGIRKKKNRNRNRKKKNKNRANKKQDLASWFINRDNFYETFFSIIRAILKRRLPPDRSHPIREQLELQQKDFESLLKGMRDMHLCIQKSDLKGLKSLVASYKCHRLNLIGFLVNQLTTAPRSKHSILVAKQLCLWVRTSPRFIYDQPTAYRIEEDYYWLRVLASVEHIETWELNDVFPRGVLGSLIYRQHVFSLTSLTLFSDRTENGTLIFNNNTETTSFTRLLKWFEDNQIYYHDPEEEKRRLVEIHIKYDTSDKAIKKILTLNPNLVWRYKTAERFGGGNALHFAAMFALEPRVFRTIYAHATPAQRQEKNLGDLTPIELLILKHGNKSATIIAKLMGNRLMLALHALNIIAALIISIAYVGILLFAQKPTLLTTNMLSRFSLLEQLRLVTYDHFYLYFNVAVGCYLTLQGSVTRFFPILQFFALYWPPEQWHGINCIKKEIFDTLKRYCFLKFMPETEALNYISPHNHEAIPIFTAVGLLLLLRADLRSGAEAFSLALVPVGAMIYPGYIPVGLAYFMILLASGFICLNYMPRKWQHNQGDAVYLFYRINDYISGRWNAYKVRSLLKKFRPMLPNTLWQDLKEAAPAPLQSVSREFARAHLSKIEFSFFAKAHNEASRLVDTGSAGPAQN